MKSFEFLHVCVYDMTIDLISFILHTYVSEENDDVLTGSELLRLVPVFGVVVNRPHVHQHTRAFRN